MGGHSINRFLDFTTGNKCSFIGGYIFVGINVYIQIIFVGFETNEYKVIFVG
jgi:hypothetical protein